MLKKEMLITVFRIVTISALFFAIIAYVWLELSKSGPSMLATIFG